MNESVHPSLNSPSLRLQGQKCLNRPLEALKNQGGCAPKSTLMYQGPL